MLNEQKYFDMHEDLRTLKSLGVNTRTTLPQVTEMTQRVSQLQSVQAAHLDSNPDVNALAVRIGLHDTLDDPERILADANTVASGFNPEQRERVALIIATATDTAMGEALRRFRRAGILDAIRPTFDALAERIITATQVIPAAVGSVEDAARLKVVPEYLQLEADMTQWGTLAGLITDWIKTGILKGKGKGYTAAEFMLDDLNAYTETTAHSGALGRRAHGIAAGRPNLHQPSGSPHFNDSTPARDWPLAETVARHDQSAREELGLKK